MESNSLQLTENSSMEVMPEKDREVSPGKDREETNDEEHGNDEKGGDELELVGTVVGDDAETPRAGMVYSSEEEVRKFYDNYGKSKGFGVAKISTKSGDDGKQKYFSLACTRNGKAVSTAKESFNPRPSMKTNCKAKINVTVREDGVFVITRVYLDHNHDLNPGKVKHRRTKVLGSCAKRKLEVNDLTGVPLSKSFQSVINSDSRENLPSGCASFSKATQLRHGVGDSEALMNYFGRMRNRNSNFFYMIDENNESYIRNVFWADARCKAAFDSFGDAVYFDTTYLTHNYDMPLVTFVGVNHHGQLVLFGCGLLSTRDRDTFVWLFKSFLACMSGHSPKALVTDQCEAIQAAATEVFPDSRHRLCLWHVMNKIPLKLGGHAEYKKIKRTLKNVVYESVKVRVFENTWAKMILEHNLEDNEWLESLYKDRYNWVPVFLRNTFWAGISTSQKNESMTAFFDGYVHSKTTLKQFVEQYDSALKSKIDKESNADFASFNSVIPTITSLGIEQQFQKVYTNDIFKKFQDEVKGLVYCNCSLIKTEGSISTFEVTENVPEKEGAPWKEVTCEVSYSDEATNEVQCLCQLFEFKGILCRHALSVLIKRQVIAVSPHYILDRWRKDIRRLYTSISNVYDDFGNSEQRQRHDKLNPLLSELQRLGVESDVKCDLLMRLLEGVKEKFLTCNPVSGSGQNKQDLSMPSELIERCPPLSGKESNFDQIVKPTNKKARHGKRKEQLGQRPRDLTISERKRVCQGNPIGYDGCLVQTSARTTPPIAYMTPQDFVPVGQSFYYLV